LGRFGAGRPGAGRLKITKTENILLHCIEITSLGTYDGNRNGNVQYDKTNLTLITPMLTFLKQSVFTVLTRELSKLIALVKATSEVLKTT